MHEHAEQPWWVRGNTGKNPDTGRVAGSFPDVLLQEAMRGHPSQRAVVDAAVSRYLAMMMPVLEQANTTQVEIERRRKNLRVRASSIFKECVDSGEWEGQFRLVRRVVR